MFVVCYQQFVEGKHLHAALYSAGYGAETVAGELHRWLSMRVNAAPLRDVFMKPSGSSQGSGRDV
jgi:hypothetical protein